MHERETLFVMISFNRFWSLTGTFRKVFLFTLYPSGGYCVIPPLISWPLFQYVIHCRDQATLFICLFHLNTFIVCFCVAAAEGVFKGKIDCKRSLMESISAISKICTNLLPISLDADAYAVISEINYISVFVTFYLHVFAKQRSLFAAQFFC